MLRDGGIFAQNVIDQPPLRFLGAVVATLREVFEHVAVIGAAGALRRDGRRQQIVIASDAPLPLDAHPARRSRPGVMTTSS